MGDDANELFLSLGGLVLAVGFNFGAIRAGSGDSRRDGDSLSLLLSLTSSCVDGEDASLAGFVSCKTADFAEGPTDPSSSESSSMQKLSCCAPAATSSCGRRSFSVADSALAVSPSSGMGCERSVVLTGSSLFVSLIISSFLEVLEEDRVLVTDREKRI